MTVLIPPRGVKSPTTVMRSGRAGGHEVVENLVGDALVEDAAGAETDQVIFQ